MNTSRWRTKLSLGLALSALAACFPKALTVPGTSPSVATSGGSRGDSGSVGGNSANPASADSTVQPTATQEPTTPQASASSTARIIIDKPELATASIVATTDKQEDLPAGGLMSLRVEYASLEATPSDVVTLTLASAGMIEYLGSLNPGYHLNHFQVAAERQTDDGLQYAEVVATASVDTEKKTLTFVPVAGSGVYTVLAPELEPTDKKDFPYFEGVGENRIYQYSPLQDQFVVGGDGFHFASREEYSILTDADIASASVLFVPGDGHDKEPGNWHALKFYRYAYHYAKPEDRAWAWKRMVPMVIAYDTRLGIDGSAEQSVPHTNMRIGFSYGALRNRASRAIANEIRAAAGYTASYLHHFGDISWAGEHLGIKIADPKAWRAGTQRRPYSTSLALAHGAFFHNMSTPLTLRPLKNMEDPIRELGTSWQAYGHRSFFPPARRYPVQYAFITFFQFGKIGGIPWPEYLTPDDAYSLPCSGASKNFAGAAGATGKTIGGECRYNFIQSLEWLEEKYGKPHEIRYAGYFADIPELSRAHREFTGLVATKVSEVIQWKGRSAATDRRALAWMQTEQALPPHNLPCGDGIADCASVLGYEGVEPLILRSGNQLNINTGALDRVKPPGIEYRLIRNASHADFAGRGSDDPRVFTDEERAIYDSTLADLRAYDAAALPTGTHTLSGTDVRSGMREYLGKQAGDGWSYDSAPYRTGPDRFEFTFWVEVRVPEVGHYIDERDEYYTAKFRWYNGRWWFDGDKPQYRYSRYINR